ncbi:hypothetical protein CLHUN_42890 [Ruminiclostridium hungatei]|uniref:Uncharacterized protein n=1 Tax=Ruminiclostridium hungatei TaxID=48256 RepID=A0A1V4SF26_RUMHU|nr:hypothetical protein CLHUN_42890 [Ruminiclostridium hungatei]
MGRPRKTPGMSEGKQNIIRQLLQEYDIQSAEDIQRYCQVLCANLILPHGFWQLPC